MGILPNCELICPCTCRLTSSTLAKWTSTSCSSCPNTWHRSVLLWDHSWRWWRNMRFVALLRHGLWRLATLYTEILDPWNSLKSACCLQSVYNQSSRMARVPMWSAGVYLFNNAVTRMWHQIARAQTGCPPALKCVPTHLIFKLTIDCRWHGIVHLIRPSFR